MPLCCIQSIGSLALLLRLHGAQSNCRLRRLLEPPFDIAMMWSNSPLLLSRVLHTGLAHRSFCLRRISERSRAVQFPPLPFFRALRRSVLARLTPGLAFAYLSLAEAIFSGCATRHTLMAIRLHSTHFALLVSRSTIWPCGHGLPVLYCSSPSAFAIARGVVGLRGGRRAFASAWRFRLDVLICSRCDLLYLLSFARLLSGFKRFHVLARAFALSGSLI